MRVSRSARRTATLLAVGLAATAATWLFTRRLVATDPLPPGDYQPRLERDWPMAADRAAALREEALRHARVWREPPEPIERVDLTRNPGDDRPLDPSGTVVCKFLPRVQGGTTPKFDCVLPGGEVIRVKYGSTAEKHAEVAAARLLAALGFGADRMYLVPRVRCFGCPRAPFRTYQVLEMARAVEAYNRWIDYDDFTDFPWPGVERRFDAAAIATPEVRGWAFHELERIDPGQGGASRAEVDALRSMAVFLHHWDNKAENQRLVCLAEPRGDQSGACPEPFALLQDVGSTFGPPKVDLSNWSRRPFWSDAATCELSMKDLPFGGATFPAVRVTEEGRRFLADRLTKLSESQIRDLFVAARFAEYHSSSDPGADVMNWVRAFQRKVREIADRPPCP